VFEVLVCSDVPALRTEIRRTIESADLTVEEFSSGPECLASLAAHEPDLVIVDLQVGAMGGMAICMDIRHAESYGAAEAVPVLMLLDRRPDVFLARRSGAEGFVLTPLDPVTLRRAVRALLAGGDYEDTARTPVTVPVGGPDTQ
jgi:CheY-like chemotaxis protein